MIEVGWLMFSTLMENLANQIRHSGYQFDIILTPQFGGWIPGRVLKSKLKIPHMINVEFFGDIPLEKLTNKRVLIVDDIADSGQTLIDIITQISSVVSGVKTATIFRDKDCKINVDFYVIQSDDWIVFPWEEGEDRIRGREVKDK